MFTEYYEAKVGGIEANSLCNNIDLGPAHAQALFCICKSVCQLILHLKIQRAPVPTAEK